MTRSGFEIPAELLRDPWPLHARGLTESSERPSEIGDKTGTMAVEASNCRKPILFALPGFSSIAESN